MLDFIKVCKACKRVRLENHMTQLQVAEKVGYGVKTISAFEHGRVNNALLLLWYLEHGLIKYIEGDCNNATFTHSIRNDNKRHYENVNVKI